MRSRWPALARTTLAVTLALTFSLSGAGCFDTHGHGPDAGAPLDTATSGDAWLALDSSADSCRTIGATEVRSPRVLLDDQPLTVTLLGAGSGCGCTPRATLEGATASDAVLSLCACCELCDCVDPGYEASTVEASPRAPGDHTLSTPLGPRPLRVTPRAETSPIAADGLRAVPASDAVVTGGPDIRWVVVETTVAVCCVEPLVAIDATLDGSGALVLEPRVVLQDDCACAGDPRRLDVWWPIRSAPGLRVRAGGTEVALGGL